jgi:heme exporter protein CcmD
MMLSQCMDFFRMGGYGFYVWGAYGCVFFYLLIQWFVPWRRWQHYLREHMTGPENRP